MRTVHVKDDRRHREPHIMNSMELVRYVSTGARPRQIPKKRSVPLFSTELAGPARNTILRARQFLVGEQRDDGMWLGTQTSDASMPSQLVFWLAYAGRENSELAQQCASTIFDRQMPAGGWSLTPGGPADVSTSVQAYFALKLLGLDPSSERLASARQTIRQLGGADVADATTRYFLALFSQISYDHCRPATPERLLFTGDYRRCGPLSIIWSHRPVRDVGIERGARELFIQPAGDWSDRKNDQARGKIATILRSSLAFATRQCDRYGWTPLRRRAIDRIEGQSVQHVDAARIGELCLHELIWHMIALQTTGFAPESSEMQSCENRLRELVHVDEDADVALPQYQLAPLADTALVVRSLVASGMSMNHVAIAGAIESLCVVATGTSSPWMTELCSVLSATRPATDCPSESRVLPPGIEVCWDWSRDDGVSPSDEKHGAKATKRTAAGAIEQLLRHQNADGGWGEYTRAQNGRCESAPDITGAVLEVLHGLDHEDSQLAKNRAVVWLRNAQGADGSWTDGAVAEHIHATSFAIRGLLAAGVSSEDEAISAGVNWLIVHQHTGGGWLEVAHADEEASQRRASATSTAWALLALVAAGKANHLATRRGISLLVETQDDDGRWYERDFVLHDAATNHWYSNDLQATAWPLLALSRWIVAAISAQSEAADDMSLRLVGVSAAD